MGDPLPFINCQLRPPRRKRLGTLRLQGILLYFYSLARPAAGSGGMRSLYQFKICRILELRIETEKAKAHALASPV